MECRSLEGPGVFALKRPYHQDLQQVVLDSWNKNLVGVVDKLKEVKEESLFFNKEVFRNIFRRKILLEARIAGIQRWLENFDCWSLVPLESKLQAEYNQVLRQEEML